MNIFNKNKVRGFTLIEMVVVVAVMVILMVTATEIFSNLYSISVRNNDGRMVLQEARYALETISRETRDSVELVPVNNWNDPGTIDLKNKKGQNIRFECINCSSSSNSGRIVMNVTNYDGSQNPVTYLTNDRVEVTQFSISPQGANEYNMIDGFSTPAEYPFFELRIQVRGKLADRTGSKANVTLKTAVTRNPYSEITYCNIFPCVDVIPEVASKSETSYGLMSNGSLLMWGMGYDSNVNLYPTPVADIGGTGELKNIVDIDTSYNKVLALRVDGTVLAWGSGILGDGTGNASQYPVQVRDPSGTGYLSDIVAISAGDSTSLALRSDGTVWAWGTGGLVGDGTNTTRYLPVQVKGLNNVGYLTDIVSISAGDGNSLVLTRNGTVYSWGENGYGQLGTGEYGSSTSKNYPVAVANTAAGTNIRAIAAGGSFSLSLSNDGYVRSWGLSYYGQCGYGSNILRVTPGTVSVLGNTSNANIYAQGAYALALKSTGTAYAWGYNAYGNLGNNSTTNALSPVVVNGGITYNKLGMGGYTTLGLRTDGTVYAWGNNNFGQVGNGTTSFSEKVPIQVKGPGGVGNLDLIP